jgi:hypothetical protein
MSNYFFIFLQIVLLFLFVLVYNVFYELCKFMKCVFVLNYEQSRCIVLLTFSRKTSSRVVKDRFIVM